MRAREPESHGFSTVELLLAVTLIAVITVIAVPRFGGDGLGSVSARSAAREIAGDMRLCRTLAISEASGNPSGYSIRMDGSAPYSGYSLVNRGSGGVVWTKTFPDGVTASGNSEFRFGPLGSLMGSSGTALTVTGGSKSCVLNLTAANGTVRITQ